MILHAIVKIEPKEDGEQEQGEPTDHGEPVDDGASTVTAQIKVQDISLTHWKIN